MVLSGLLAGFLAIGAGYPEPLPFPPEVLQAFAWAAPESIVPVVAPCGPCQCTFLWRKLRFTTAAHAMATSANIAEFTGRVEVLPPCHVRLDLDPWIRVYPRPWETAETAPQSGPCGGRDVTNDSCGCWSGAGPGAGRVALAASTGD